MDECRRVEAERERALHAEEVSDWIGGHVLAWLGGVATLAGIVFFLVIAVSRGWLGMDARVALGGAASALLVGVGVLLHARRGRTEASVVLVGVGIAGLFASLVVAGDVYALIPPLLAVGGSMLVGALATFLAVRWAGRAIGALGLVGALISPVLVGAPSDGVTTAMVLVASAAGMWTVVSQRWGWLGVATVLAGASQWATWILAGQPVVVDLGVLVSFGVIGLAGALAMTRTRSDSERLDVFSLALLALNACLVGALGWIGLNEVAGQGVASGWLGALAVVHLVLGFWRTRHLPVSEPLRRLLMATGVILGDAAFGLSVHGLGLAIGWGAAAVGFAWLTRRRIRPESDDVLLALGLGAHVSLTLVRVCFLALPSFGGDSSQLVAMLAVGTLAASCLACGQLISARRSSLAVGLSALGLAAIAYLTSQGLSGPALVAAWAFEGVALAQLARRTDDDAARYGGLVFLGLAAAHTSLIEAPPSALVIGVTSLANAAMAIGAVSLATVWIAELEPEGSFSRKWLLGAGAGSLLYLMSVAIITGFQPANGASLALLDLGIRQWGQVVLSAAWSLLGVIALIVGLRRNMPFIRNGALGVLLLTVAKVALYDLSTLTSLYRVISCIALGLLLLTGAFAYQRLKPPPAPDMRSLHPSQR